MRLQRLGWAGLEIECDGESLVIDYVQDKSPMAPFLRNPHEWFPACSRPGDTAAALLTHLHADHADPDALAKALWEGAPVYRPEPGVGNAVDNELTSIAEAKFARQSLAVEVVGPWREFAVGPFRMFSIPAVDGFGDPQLSWIVECGGQRIFHAGDTLFHGNWWRIAHRFGPIAAAFLPINAPICNWPALQPPSPLEATLTPEEAAIAAHILGAQSIVPIHYGSLNKRAEYEETPHPLERLQKKASALGIRTHVEEPGTWFDLG